MLTGNVELGALIEETKTLSTRALADQAREGTAQKTAVGLGAVTGVDGLVAAGEGGLVTTLGLSLADSHVLGDGELDVVGSTIHGTSVGHHVGQSNGRSGESEEDSELHCDCGFGFEREY